MKNLLFLLLLFLLPMLCHAQKFEYDGTKVEYVDLKGDKRETTTFKRGYVAFNGSEIVYFEKADEWCYADHLDTLEVISEQDVVDDGHAYIISKEEYFIKYSTHVTHVSKCGGLWVYENLFLKENY